ncbi:MAG: SRPBCC family protein [Beijerinckiaceae bacterium]
MLKYVMWATVAIAVAIAVLLIYASTRPDQFRISRSIEIAAPPEKVFPLINTIRTFDTWNPFAAQDGMKLSYSGPEAGPGATDSFSGRGGTGKLAIVESKAPAEVVMQLDMEKPVRGHNRIVFVIAPSQAGSNVSWTMSGNTPFIGKVIHTIVSLERMIGPQFERGLRDLKALAEKP